MGWRTMDFFHLGTAVLTHVPWASILITFVVILAFNSRWLRNWSLLRSMPGPGTDWFPPWLLLWHYWKYGKNFWMRDATMVIPLFVNSNAKTYEGKTFKLYVGMSPIVIVHTPQASEVLLTSKKSLKRPFMYRFFIPWLGPKNILTSEGDGWKNKARIVKAAFSSAHLEMSMSIFNRNVKILMERIEAIAVDSHQKTSDCFKMIQYFVMDNVTQSTLAEDLQLQKEKNQHYAECYLIMTWLLVARIVRPWAWFQWLYSFTPYGKVWSDTANKIEAVHWAAIEKRALAVRRKLADVNESSEMCEDNLNFSHVVDTFLKKNMMCPDYTMQEAVYDTIATVFAAADSSTSAISFAIYLLGLNPDKQAKLQKELDDVFGPGVDREYTCADLKKLPYLDCCFKKAIRLCPPFPMVGRELTEDLIIDGHTVPAGMTCLVNLYTLHRNKEVYTDPDMYIPERFLPENSAKIPLFAFLPFSAGVKPCLGQKFGNTQAKVVLATVFSKYSVESILPVEELSLRFEVSLRAKEKLNVKFHKRSL